MAPLDQKITVCGWVRTFRNDRFLAVNDGSTLNNLQMVIQKEDFDEELLKQLNTGAAVSVEGVLVASQGAGQTVELQLRSIELLGGADPDDPRPGNPLLDYTPRARGQPLRCRLERRGLEWRRPLPRRPQHGAARADQPPRSAAQPRRTSTGQAIRRGPQRRGAQTRRSHWRRSHARDTQPSRPREREPDRSRPQ